MGFFGEFFGELFHFEFPPYFSGEKTFGLDDDLNIHSICRLGKNPFGEVFFFAGDFSIISICIVTISLVFVIPRIGQSCCLISKIAATRSLVIIY